MKNYWLQLLLLTVMFLTGACNNKKSTENSTTIKVDTQVFVNPKEESKVGYADTVKVKYQDNNEMLDIIPLIPDSAMQSWQWSKAEREGFLSSIKASGYFIDTTKDYNTLLKITPHYFETQVVDGIFTVASYKVNDSSKLIITCDVVGDGKYLCAYRIKQNEISQLRLTDLYDTFENYTMQNPADTKCAEKVLEARPFSAYDFTGLNTIKIILPITKAQANGCLKGNALTLNFNPYTARFNLQNISWN
jgi:hypothetical protein